MHHTVHHRAWIAQVLFLVLLEGNLASEKITLSFHINKRFLTPKKATLQKCMLTSEENICVERLVAAKLATILDDEKALLADDGGQNFWASPIDTCIHEILHSTYLPCI